MLFNSIGCLVQSPPLTFPHLYDSETLLLYKTSSEFIEFSFPTATFDIFFSERSVELLTGTKVIKATHFLKHSIAMRTKPINTEAVFFLMSACCIEALNFKLWSCSLKIGHDHSFKATGLVVSRCQSNGL